MKVRKDRTHNLSDVRLSRIVVADARHTWMRCAFPTTAEKIYVAGLVDWIGLKP